MGCQCFKAEEPIQVKASTFMDTDEKGEPNKVVYGFRPEDGKEPRKLVFKCTFNKKLAEHPVKVAWIAQDTKGVAPENYEVVAVNFPMVMEQITSKATLPRDWPVGTYRVDVFVKDKLCKSEEFTIANM